MTCLTLRRGHALGAIVFIAFLAAAVAAAPSVHHGFGGHRPGSDSPSVGNRTRHRHNHQRDGNHSGGGQQRHGLWKVPNPFKQVKEDLAEIEGKAGAAATANASAAVGINVTDTNPDHQMGDLGRALGHDEQHAATELKALEKKGFAEARDIAKHMPPAPGPSRMPPLPGVLYYGCFVAAPLALLVVACLCFWRAGCEQGDHDVFEGLPAMTHRGSGDGSANGMDDDDDTFGTPSTPEPGRIGSFRDDTEDDFVNDAAIQRDEREELPSRMELSIEDLPGRHRPYVRDWRFWLLAFAMRIAVLLCLIEGARHPLVAAPHDVRREIGAFLPPYGACHGDAAAWPVACWDSCDDAAAPRGMVAVGAIWGGAVTLLALLLRCVECHSDKFGSVAFAAFRTGLQFFVSCLAVASVLASAMVLDVCNLRMMGYRRAAGFGWLLAAAIMSTVSLVEETFYLTMVGIPAWRKGRPVRRRAGFFGLSSTEPEQRVPAADGDDDDTVDTGL